MTLDQALGIVVDKAERWFEMRSSDLPSNYGEEGYQPDHKSNRYGGWHDHELCDEAAQMNEALDVIHAFRFTPHKETA